MYFPLLYSETHYHLKYLYPLYFKREAEALFDMPTRVLIKRTHNKIPIFLLIKDADKYPISISEVCIVVFFKGNKKEFNIKEQTIVCNESLRYYEFEIDVVAEWINQHVSIVVEFKLNGTRYINDNFHGNVPHLFKVFICDKEKVFPTGWYIGDTHYHSSFTSDQVEFGAPLEMTKKIAKTMGLDWFFVTDHSYDLDDMIDDYTQQDHEHRKWNILKRECHQLSDEETKIQFGEEVSVGNRLGQNVHLLSINYPNFMIGKGDSAEKWFQNKPDIDLRMLPINNTAITLSDSEEKKVQRDNIENMTLLIAAHPFEKIPYLQRKLLNRGNWSEMDFTDSKVEYLQIINGLSFFENLDLINKYFKLLLNGQKYYIVAGNDAHGNFQFMKQIQIPFIKLMCRKQQLFGACFTAFQYENNNPIEGIKSKRIIISNGPFLNFTINYNEKKYHIGESVHVYNHNKITLQYEYLLETQRSTSHKQDKKNVENASIDNKAILQMIIGKINSKVIYKSKLDISTDRIEVLVDEESFVILVLRTLDGHFALTNPIWVNVSTDPVNDLF